MNRGQTTPVSLVLGLLAGNVMYLLFTVILSMILGVTPTGMLSGPFSGSIESLVSGWKAVGALLGVTDVLVVVGCISSVFGGR